MCGWVLSQVAPIEEGRDKDMTPKNVVPKGFISAIKAWLPAIELKEICNNKIYRDISCVVCVSESLKIL